MKTERPNSTENFGSSANDSSVDCNSVNSQRHNSSPQASSHTTDFNSNESHPCDDYEDEYDDHRDNDSRNQFDVEYKNSNKIFSLSNYQKSSPTTKEYEIHQQSSLTDYSIDQLLRSSKSEVERKEYKKIGKRKDSLLIGDVNLTTMSSDTRVPSVSLHRPFQVSSL